MSPNEILIHDHLVSRRQQLAGVTDLPEHPRMIDLLLEVDSALERLDHGDWGLCTICHGPVESDRLLTDPLVSVCLDCLTIEQRSALEHDLATASQIQSALLPARLVETPAWEIASVYEPLGAVSGDYIDVIKSVNGSGHPLVTLGDVAGKGVAAAMVMSHLHALLRSLIQLDLPLPELLDRANAMLLAATTASSYATLVVIRLFPDGTAEVANGGHEPPIAVRSDGVEPLPVTGMPVGLLPSVSFRTHRIRLEPGDSLLLFTDGLSEAPDENGSEFGRRRAASIAGRNQGKSAAAILASTREELDAFLDGGQPADDLSLMAIRRL